MTFTPANATSLVAFNLVLIVVLGSFWHALFRTSPVARRKKILRTGVGLSLAWLGIVSLVSASSALQMQPLPLLPAFLGMCNLMGLALALSPWGTQLARGVPISKLILFQSFRLPLELVLHAWAAQKVIPQSMTWTGSNWDIVTGVVSLLAAPFADRSRVVAWAANVIGLGLLANVARVAVMSSPLPFAWPVDPPLTLAYHFPYVLIVPVCVAGALAGHVILTRKLLGK